jgi:S-DNA-T family DNA segregation ATPase FtsK/SpoIIIE
LHLILGTQSPAEVVTEELAANLQFRVGFRVQSIEASRAVLRRPDAAYLPADWPGRAYLQVGERGVFRQFQTAYAGGDYVLERVDGEEMTLEILTDDGGVIDLLDDTQPMDADNLLPHTVARAVVELILDYSQLNDVPFMPPLLLPPLGDRVPLRTSYTVAAIMGWNGEAWPQHENRGAAPVGLTDDLTARQQGAIWLDLHASTLISGAPGSGKTWALWTLGLSMSLLNSPDAVHLYALSLTGSLDTLGELPHVQPVAGSDPERVRRLFRRLLGVLDARQSGETPSPMIGLLIDGFEAFRDAYYDAHLGDLERLIAEGRAHGIAVVLTCTSVSALPERLRALIPRRIALRPAHPGEWTAAVGTAAPRPETSLPPGRGIVTGSPPLSVQLCLPSEFPTDSAAIGLRETGTEMRESYRKLSGHDRGPLPVKRLPNRLPFQLPAVSDQQPAQNGMPLPTSVHSNLGVIDDDSQSPFIFDWDAGGPHVVIAGGARSGKTNLLHAAALSAALSLSPDVFRLLLVDFTGRSLRALTGLPHALHITDPQMLDSALQSLNASPARAAILIDDYDLAADVLNSEGGNLLRTLRDIARLRAGTHIWTAGYLDRAGDPLIRHLMMKRAGFAMGGRDAMNALGLRAGPDLGVISAPGRAIYAHDNRLTVVQTALVEDTAHWVTQIHAKWGELRQPQPEATVATPKTSYESTLDIDTDGLIDDLLGGRSG